MKRIILCSCLVFCCEVAVFGATKEFTSAGTDNNWSTDANWDFGIPIAGDDVIIPTDEVCVVNVNTALIGNLTVEAGGQLLRNSNLGVRYINVAGNVVCDGIIGNGGATYDALVFNIEGASCTMSGTGTFDAAAIRKNTGANNVTDLAIQMNITLRTSGTGLYNNSSAAALFNITIESGATVDIPSGSVAIDGLTGSTGDGVGGGGTFAVSGALTIGRFLYLTTDDTGVSVPSTLHILPGGTVKCSTAVCTNSGSATSTLDVDAGGTLNFTSSGWGAIGTLNNIYTLDGTVEFSAAGSQTVAGPVAYTHLTVSGSGIKTLATVSVNGVFSLQGTATVSGSPTYGVSSVLEYKGASAQVASPTNEFQGVKGLRVNNVAGVSLGGNATVDGVVSFVAGNLYTTGFTLGLGTSGSISGELDGKSLIGNVSTSRDIVANTPQPFGNIGLALDGSDATALSNVTVTRTTGDNAVVSVGANNSIKRRFTVLSGNTLSRNVTCTWLQSEDNGKGPDDVGIWQKTGSTWFIVGASEDVSSNPRSLSKAVSSFSGQFTVTDDLNALPIQLVSFQGVPSYSGILLSWRTLSEVNNYGFYVQRSSDDGITFTTLTESFIPGHGTTNTPQSYSFSDVSVGVGSWYYRLKQIDLDGSINYSDAIRVDVVTGVEENYPSGFNLSQNYPNPFNPSTEVRFSVEKQGRATLTVYNMLGQHVQTLFDDQVEAGREYTARFVSAEFASGVFWYKLESAGQLSMRRMVLLK